MNLKLVTPTQVVTEGQVDAVSIPGESGEMDVRPGHTFLTSLLREGEIVYQIGDNVKTVNMRGQGFVEISQDTVTVIVNDFTFKEVQK